MGAFDPRSFSRGSTLRFEDTEVHWHEVGQGRPLVLLHGLADSHRGWRRVVPYLAERRRVLLPDLPGHGFSGRHEGPYDVVWMADHIGRWLDALELEAFDLVGHSLGGGIALYQLLSRASRVRRLGLVSSGGLGREVTWAMRLLSLRLMERMPGLFLRWSTELSHRFLAGRSVEPEERRWLAEMNGSPGSIRAISRLARDTLSLRGQCRHVLDYADEIDRLPPVSLFWGERDPVLPWRHGQAALELFEGSELVSFSGCGHFPQLQEPEMFARALTLFLDRGDAPSVRLVKRPS